MGKGHVEKEAFGGDSKKARGQFHRQRLQKQKTATAPNYTNGSNKAGRNETNKTTKWGRGCAQAEENAEATVTSEDSKVEWILCTSTMRHFVALYC